MIFETLRQFDDIHTHVMGNPRAVCSLPPEEAIILSHTCQNQSFSIMLHPWQICQHPRHDLFSQFAEAVSACSSDERFVAIGECGLDSECDTPLSDQIACFEQALLIARQYRKPVILHIVRMWDQLLLSTRRVFGQGGAATADAEGCRLIVHGYRKNLALAQQLVAQGYYLSLGSKFNPAVLTGIAPEKIYRETDETAK